MNEIADEAVLMEVLHDNVLLERDASHKVSAGGIVIPDAFQQKPKDCGRVVAIGPGRYSSKINGRLPMHVQLGDEVFYMRHGAVPVKYKGKEYILIGQNALLATIETKEVEAA